MRQVHQLIWARCLPCVARVFLFIPQTATNYILRPFPWIKTQNAPSKNLHKMYSIEGWTKRLGCDTCLLLLLLLYVIFIFLKPFTLRPHLAPILNAHTPKNVFEHEKCICFRRLCLRNIFKWNYVWHAKLKRSIKRRMWGERNK